jgi:hypothetical protein
MRRNIHPDKKTKGETMNKHYCKEHQQKIMASGGGTYCRFHKQELCRHIEPHCYQCGKKIDEVEKKLIINIEWKLLERIAEFYGFPSAVFLMQKKDFPKVKRDEILSRKAEALDKIKEIMEEEYDMYQ